MRRVAAAHARWSVAAALRGGGADHVSRRLGDASARAIASCSSALRLALLALLLFCLFRPSLILKAAVPQQNFLGVLIDDSRSMTIADRDGQPRSDFVQQQFGGPNGPLLEALSQRFVLRFFRFSSSADRAGVRRRSEVRRARRRGSDRRSSARATSCRACRWPAS